MKAFRTLIFVVAAAAAMAFVAPALAKPAPIAPDDSMVWQTNTTTSNFDLRSPDTREAAVLAHSSTILAPDIDLRSPDTREAALLDRSSAILAPNFDLRSADTRDAVVTSQPARPASEVLARHFQHEDAMYGSTGTGTSSSATSSSDGLDTGILAGSIGGALLLAAGVGTAVVLRRRHGRMAIS